MNGEGCWSTVVCTPAERAALGLTGDSEWLLHCRLAAGHSGNHATDASPYPRSDRRLWLEWNDFDDRAQSLIERNPCTVHSLQGAPCLYFESHGGPHYFAQSNGHATPHRPRNGQSVTGRTNRSASPFRPPHPDQLDRTTDAEVPRVRPTTPPAPAPQVSPNQNPHVPMGAATGERAIVDPAQEPEAEMSGAHAGAGHESYRGGRRSTGAEPPPAAPFAGSRHRMPDAGEASTPPAIPPKAPAAGPHVMGHPQSTGLPPAPRDLQDSAIAAALSDIAVALERLADALRRR